MPLQPFVDIEIGPALEPPFVISPDETRRFLDVPNLDQEQDTWCYAACAEMVFKYYRKKKPNGTEITQCNVVESVVHKINSGARCCTDPPDEVCTDKGCEPDDIVTIYQEFSLGAIQKTGQVSFDVLKSEINKGRPVEVCIQWGEPDTPPELFSAHVLIIRGWIESSIGNFLKILDPSTGTGSVGGVASIGQLERGFDEGVWKLTFLGFPDKLQ